MEVAKVQQKKLLKALDASKVKDKDVMLQSVNKEDNEDEEEWDSDRFKRKMKKVDEER